MGKNFKALGCALFVLLWSLKAAAYPLDLEFRAFPRDKCPSHMAPIESNGRTALSSVSSALAAAAISNVVDRVGKTLVAAGAAKAETYEGPSMTFDLHATNANGLAEVNPQTRCWALVLGHFNSDRLVQVERSAALAAARKDIPDWFGIALDKIHKETSLISIPAFYAEVILVPRGVTSIEMRLARVYVHQYSFDRWRTAPREYKIELSFRSPQEIKPFAAANFSLNALASGTLLLSCNAKNVDLVTAPCIESSEGILSGVTTGPMSSLLESDTFKVSKAQYANLVAPYVETIAIFKAEEEATKVAANPMLQPIPRRSADEELATSNKLAAYCNALMLANNSRPPIHHLTDENCPSMLVDARATFAKDKQAAQLTVDLEWAKKFISRRCPMPNSGETEVSLATRCFEDKVKAIRLTGVAVVTGTSAVAWAKLTEVRPPNPIIQFFAEIFTTAKSEISTSLQNELIPAKKEALETAAETASIESRQALALADANVRAAEAALAAKQSGTDMSSIASAERDLIKAQIESNRAYRKAGVAVRYPQFD